jgi:hypothetical protein
METELWKQIVSIYKEKFSADESIINLIAVKDILKLAVCGLSNTSIANHYDFDILYIQTVLKEFLDFEGWDTDLDFSPMLIYKNNTLFGTFFNAVALVSAVSEPNLVQKSFELCEKFSEIERTINANYPN